MPIDSFSLVFDGHPAPDQSWKLFQAAIVGAATFSMSDVSEAFRQAIYNIVNGKKSLIRCDFPSGDLYEGETFKRDCLDPSCK